MTKLIIDYENLHPKNSQKILLGAHFPDSVSIECSVSLTGLFLPKRVAWLRTVFSPLNSEKDNFMSNFFFSIHSKGSFSETVLAKK